MLRVCLVVLLCGAFASQAQDATALKAQHAALRDQLANNPFGRPLQVESSVDAGAHKGEIYAVLEQPFGVVAPALARPANWCDILTLQLNIKRCSAADGESLTAFITRKPRDPVDSAHRVDFRYEPVAARSDYLRVELGAPSGPVGTRDYRILLEATPLDSRRTFMHLSYTYTLGRMARFAMDAYLTTGAGRDKRGFTVEGGERGVVERSAMRHYLAIEAYLGSIAAPAEQRLETRLRNWYAAISRYPQLREPVGADEYVEMKRREASAALAG
jgi:hypothetical protein